MCGVFCGGHQTAFVVRILYINPTYARRVLHPHRIGPKTKRDEERRHEKKKTFLNNKHTVLSVYIGLIIMDRTAPPPIPQFSSRPPAAVPVDNATMALPSSSPLPSMSLSLTSPRHTDSGSRYVSGPGTARHTDPSSSTRRNPAEEPSHPPKTPHRWHHRLAPRVERHSPTNALPWPFGGWVHPTHVEFRLPGPGGVHLGRGLVHRRSWRSRQHRKGRYIGTSPKGRARRVEAMVKRKGGIRGKWRRLILKIGRMRMVEYWNISWWVAVVRLSFFFFFAHTSSIVFPPTCRCSHWGARYGYSMASSCSFPYFFPPASPKAPALGAGRRGRVQQSLRSEQR